jgi:hypothetical protein
LTGKHVAVIGVVTSVAACALAAGCSASPKKPAATAIPATASPTNPATAATLGALAAYNGMIADWVEVAKTSNYQDPTLTRHTSGTALSRLIRIVAAAQAAGVVSKGQPTGTAKVVQLTPANAPTQAEVIACADDTNWLQYELDGSRVPGGPGGRHHVEVQVQNFNGVWKVTHFDFQPVGTC